jgi:hypothetical protein
MVYKEYPGINKTYVVVHQTGTGPMEDPYIEKGPIFFTNSLAVANKVVSKNRKYHNSPAELRSSWVPNTYVIHVNTLTKKGAFLLKKFHELIELKHKHVEENLDLYDTYELDGKTLYLKKDSLFSESLLHPRPLESYEMKFINMNE